MLIIHPNIYEELAFSWNSMSMQAFRIELCKCFFLTELSIAILYGNVSPEKFVIDSIHLESIIEKAGIKSKQPYRIGQRILKSLSSYIERIKIGYSVNGIYEKSYYKVTRKFDLLLDNIECSNNNLYEYDISDKTIYFSKTKIYEYNNKKYLNIHDIKPNELFESYGKQLNYIKNNCNIIYEPESNIKDFVHSVIPIKQYKETYQNKNNQAIIFSHHSKLSRTNIEQIYNYEQEKGNDSVTIHIIKRIMNNISKNGIYLQEYYRGSHGRLYQHGYNLQQLNKQYREYILNEYVDIDIKSATFSILTNYALSLGIKESELGILIEYTNDPDKFRNYIHNQLLLDDPNVTYKYVKDVLNAIAFGARISESQIIADFKNRTSRTIPVQTSGYDNSYTPINIISMPEIKELISCMQNVSKMLTSKLMTNNGILMNCLGQPLQIYNRMSYGKKLAHIYQGAEVTVLEKMLEYPYNNSNIKSIHGALGLLLHDGFYLRHDIASNIGAPQCFEQYLKKTMSYSLKLS